MQKVQAYRVEIPIVATDEYSVELNKAGKAVSDVEKKAKKGAKAQDNLAKSGSDVAKSQSGVEKSSKQAAKGIETIGKSADQTERKVTRAGKVITSFGSKVKSLQRAKANIEVAVKDNASRVLNRIGSTWTSFRRHPVIRLTIYAVDRAWATLRGIKNTVLSIPTMITIGLTYVGVKNLSEATVGAAMKFEQYEISMTHWLDGNTKKAKELITWMGQFADATPFSSPDLFPALTTGVSLSSGNLTEAQRLLKIASDMAALTPGSTPVDAMDALAAAQVGEFERMKAFGMKLNKKQYEAMGGWEGFLKQTESTFMDGAKKLSQTAAGVLATLKGYRSSFMRSIGTGFLEPMKPRLDAINKWLENNQETWGRWKDVAMGHGKDISEGIFSTLEKGFDHVRNDYLDNPDFMNLDLKGKISFISDDIGGFLNSEVKPRLTEWWDETGSGVALEIGKSIGSGIVEGIKLGIKSGAKFLSASYEDFFENIKENPFSLETGKSFLTAAIATAGAGYIGSKILKPVIGTGKMINRGRKGVFNSARWLMDRMPERSIRPKDISKTERIRLAKAEMEAARRYSQSPQAYRPPKNVTNKLGISSMSKIPFLRTGLNLLSLSAASEEEIPGLIGSIVGGIAGAKGGVMAGAAIGSVVPGVGTVIGGAAGGIIGGIGGSLGGEWIGNHWDSIKEKASEAATWVGAKFSETKESLSSTLFSGDWWGSKWEDVKQTATDTVFSAGWWAEQAGMVWGTLDTTLFSGEWWASKWDGVKGWTSQKFDEWGEIYDNVTTKISETIFNSGWWSGKWADAKSWAETTIDGFGSVWSNALGAAESTLFNSEWWGGKWGQLKSWASSTWESIKSGFDVGYNKGSNQTYGPPAPQAKYAKGGIATRPHIGLVAEAGVPEAMIPWDGSNRSKMLWQQTGEALGMFGSISASSNSQSIQPSGSSSGGSLTLNIGDIMVGQASDMSAEGILNLIMPVLYQHIQAALAKK